MDLSVFLPTIIVEISFLMMIIIVPVIIILPGELLRLSLSVIITLSFWNLSSSLLYYDKNA